MFSDFSGEKPGQDQKEDWLTILKKGVKLIPAVLLFSMTYAVSDLLFRDLTLNNLFAAVMMAGRLQLYVWLIFLIQALVQAALLVWLIGSSRKKRNAKLFVWMLIVFPVNLGIVLLNGFRGSILAGIPFLGSTFLGRLAAYMLQAVISALLLECIFRILDKTKNSRN